MIANEQNLSPLIATRGERICADEGGSDYVMMANGRDACLKRLLFTVAIISDLTEHGHGDRWCYKTADEACAALQEWTGRGGEGEPQGWFRHPVSGRRRPNGDASFEHINH